MRASHPPINQSRQAPATSPVLRAQPRPTVVQPKLTNCGPNPFNLTRDVEPQISGQRLPSAVSLPKVNIVPPKALDGRIRQASTTPPRPAIQRRVVQRFRSAVVQATRFYPNLHPGAVEPVDPSNIFRLNSFADQYRLHKVHSHGVNVPNQQYNFVRTGEGEMLLHSRYRHPSIAEGKQVLYAGEIFFNNGKLQWWSNGSGHYQPDTDSAEQANLPMDSFFSYQQIIKGEHTRKRR
jgi:hypothetical protein